MIHLPEEKISNKDNARSVDVAMGIDNELNSSCTSHTRGGCIYPTDFSADIVSFAWLW